MRKSTLGYLHLLSLVLNSAALMLMLLTKNWFLVVLHIVFIRLSIYWFETNYFNEEKEDAIHRE